MFLNPFGPLTHMHFLSAHLDCSPFYNKEIQPIINSAYISTIQSLAKSTIQTLLLNQGPLQKKKRSPIGPCSSGDLRRGSEGQPCAASLVLRMLLGATRAVTPRWDPQVAVFSRSWGLVMLVPHWHSCFTPLVCIQLAGPHGCWKAA